MSDLRDQAARVRRVKASEVEVGDEIILPEFVGKVEESREEDVRATWCLALEGGEAAEVDRDQTVFVLTAGVSGDERVSGVNVIGRNHDAYPASREDGYQAACHDCPWTGSMSPEKDSARAEAIAHEAEMGVVYEVPEQVLTTDPRCGVSGDERQPDALSLLQEVVAEAEYADGPHSIPGGWTSTKFGQKLAEAERFLKAAAVPSVARADTELREAAQELADRATWLIECLDRIVFAQPPERRVVRGLDEARASYDRSLERLKSLLMGLDSKGGDANGGDRPGGEASSTDACAPPAVKVGDEQAASTGTEDARERVAEALWDDAEHRRHRAHRLDAAYAFKKCQWSDADEFDRAEYLMKADKALAALAAARPVEDAPRLCRNCGVEADREPDQHWGSERHADEDEIGLAFAKALDAVTPAQTLPGEPYRYEFFKAGFLAARPVTGTK